MGGVLGHIICTGLAVICGALIAKKISVRMVTLIGALVFIGFAVASLFIDPYEENHLVPDVDVSFLFRICKSILVFILIKNVKSDLVFLAETSSFSMQIVLCFLM